MKTKSPAQGSAPQIVSAANPPQPAPPVEKVSLSPPDTAKRTTVLSKTAISVLPQPSACNAPANMPSTTKPRRDVLRHAYSVTADDAGRAPLSASSAIKDTVCPCGTDSAYRQ
jgi:hypothetical protein